MLGSPSGTFSKRVFVMIPVVDLFKLKDQIIQAVILTTMSPVGYILASAAVFMTIFSTVGSAVNTWLTGLPTLSLDTPYIYGSSWSSFFLYLCAYDDIVMIVNWFMSHANTILLSIVTIMNLVISALVGMVAWLYVRKNLQDLIL